MANTKKNILMAALRLFSINGYEAVSVSQIAGELGMTKGALYKHYKNKRDILIVFLNMFVDWILNAPKKQVFQKKNFQKYRNPFLRYYLKI